MAETAQTLRAALERDRPERSGDGYPAALRERVGRWVVAQKVAGVKDSRLALQLGVSTATVRTWSRAVAVVSSRHTGGFLPVVVRSGAVAEAPAGGPVLHSPLGYRVSGLGMDELVAILRRLE